MTGRMGEYCPTPVTSSHLGNPSNQKTNHVRHPIV